MKIRFGIGPFSVKRSISSAPSLLLLLLLWGTPVMGDYAVNWSTTDGGGGLGSGGEYRLTGTMGQPDAHVLSGGRYVMNGGFWPASTGCVVNLDDLTYFAEQWLVADSLSAADFDGSGRVDLADFWELSYWWLNPCPAGWPLK